MPCPLPSQLFSHFKIIKIKSFVSGNLNIGLFPNVNVSHVLLLISSAASQPTLRLESVAGAFTKFVCRRQRYLSEGSGVRALVMISASPAIRKKPRNATLETNTSSLKDAKKGRVW